MGIYEVPTQELLEKTAQKLKKLDQLTPPEWAKFVKTGVFKERAPTNPDWWYLRSASILRKLQLMGPIGVAKLRRKYGGVKNRGHKMEQTYNGSGNIVRTILQQLEDAGLAVQATRGNHKGRVATPKGISLLEKTAQEMKK